MASLLRRASAVVSSVIILLAVLALISTLLDAYTTTTAEIGNRYLRFARDSHGVMHMWGESEHDYARALGWAHAKDRGMQLFLTRIVAQGRVSELLAPSNESITIDKIIRRSLFTKHVGLEQAALTEDATKYLQAYAEGVNAYIASHSRPWPFWIVGYQPEPWQITDSLLIGKLIGWSGLASLQADLDRYIIGLIQKGDKGLALARALYPEFVPEVDDSLLKIIRQLNLTRPFFPPKLRDFAPPVTASNNWALAPHRTYKAKAILASDPHLPIDRLPAFWYECVMHLSSGAYRMGITVAGLPGLWMGRTAQISYGFTYGFGDVTDYYIEEVEGERYKRDGEWIDLEKDEVEIKCKGMESVKLVVYSTVHGVLDTDDQSLAGSGRKYRAVLAYAPLYRTRSLPKSGNTVLPALSTMDTMLHLPQARNVAEAKKIIQHSTIELTANFLLADNAGAIGYQQTGWLPIRPEGQIGVLPMMGANSAFDWQGIYPGHRLRSDDAPPSGVLATANHNVQLKTKGAARTLNFHAGCNRVDRIYELMEEEEDRYNITDMQRFQGDLISDQAKKYVWALKPLLNKRDPHDALLALWDRSYDAKSKAAVIFEIFYENLVLDVLGRVLGEEDAVEYFRQPPWSALFSFMDKLILDHDPKWNDLLWHNQSRADILLSALNKTKRELPIESIPRLGDVRRFKLHNLFFGGKLPGAQLLGIDREEVAEGCRGCIVQVQRRWTPNAPKGTMGVSYRLITDFSQPNIMYTVIPGGASDSPFSPFYANDLPRWRSMQYKVLDAKFMEPKA